MGIFVKCFFVAARAFNLNYLEVFCMRASKRILSLVLAVMMAFSVMTAGFINAYAVTVPIVPRTPDVAPNPTFTVPSYLSTYGTNHYLPGTNVEPVVKGISFYLDGATNVALTTTSSVAFGTYYTSGNTMYWDITGGSATAGQYVEFTVTYTYNSKSWTTRAYSWVCAVRNDATVDVYHRQTKSSTFKDAYGIHAIWITPTEGKFEGYIPSLVTSGSGSGYFIPESHAFNYDNSSAASAYYWYRYDSNAGSTTYTLDSQYYPSGYYYIDTSTCSNLNASDLAIKVVAFDGVFGDNHFRYLQSVDVSSQVLNGASTSGYSTNFGGEVDMAENNVYTYLINGAVPAAGSLLELEIHCKVKAQTKWGIISASMTTNESIKLKVITYNKTNLKNLLNTEKVKNRQQQYYTAASWQIYSEAYANAYAIVGKPNATQDEINNAYNNLNNAVNNVLVYNSANYSAIDNLLARIPTDYYNNPQYYTTASKTALDNAIADINYDRTLDMRYQNAVNQMAINLSNAINGLTYNTYTISFVTNGGTVQPSISAPLFDAVFEPTLQSVKAYNIFAGWYSDPDLTTPVEWPIIMPYGGKTVYAKWELATANIVFDSKGGSPVPTYTGQITSSYGGPESPTKQGYIFGGWYYDNALTSPVTWPITIPQSGYTLYAKWNPGTYTISFNTNGGSAVAPISAVYGTTVSKPTPNPTKTGYNFLNWYRDPELTQLVTWPMAAPSQDITLYAKWSATEFTITFDSKGGTPVNSITAAVGTQISAPTPPTRNGYVFNGWTYAGAPYTFSTMPAMNMTLEASWTPLTFTIYFNCGEGTPIAPITQPCGSVVAPPVNPTREGYLFTGWLLNGQPYTFTTMPAENITLVANWIVMPDMATVKLKTDLPEGTQTLEKGDVVNITVNVGTNYFAGSTQFVIFYDSTYFEPALNGNSFTESRQSAAFFNDYGKTVENFPPTSSNWNLWETGTLSGRVNTESLAGWAAYYPAEWKSNNTTVISQYLKYHFIQIQTNASSSSTAGGACIEVDPAQDFVTFQLRVKDDAPDTTGTEKARIFIPQESVKKTGTSSTGLSTVNNRMYIYKMPGNTTSSGTAIYDGIVYDFTQADLNYNIIERTSLPDYTITFDSAGGSAVQSITQEQGTSVEAPPAPTRTNYIFTGWTYNGEPVTWPLIMPGANITLTATWVPQTATYTVNHYKQNIYGTGYNLSTEDTQIITANVGTNINAVPKTMSGFTYYPDASSSTGMVTADNSLVLNLYYKRNTYTISFDSAGGSAVNPITQLYDSPVTAPADPTKIGCTFAGWKLNGTPYTFTTMPLGGASLTAAWTVNQYKMEFYINNVKNDSLTIIQNYDSAVTAPVIDVPEGYVFSGWSPAVPSRMPAGDTQYYATLNALGYDINYYLDGVLVKTNTYQAGDTVTPYEVEIPVGYKFSGWIYNGVPVTWPLIMPNNDMDVYGTLSKKRCTITFYLDGNEFDRITAQYGAAVTAPEVYVPEGYTFSGWSPAVPSTMPAEDMSIYGTLSIIEYSVKFYINNELVKTVTGPAGTAVTPPTLPAEGYTFSGWSPSVPSSMPTQNLDIYGTLTINSYTVEFVLDGTTIQSQLLEYGSPITPPTVTIPTGYSFSGWSPAVNATVPARNVTYSGTLTANSYTFTFYLNGGYYRSVTLPYGSVVTPPAVDIPEGYSFSGWTPEVPAMMTAENKSFYGTLRENTVTVSFDLNGGTGTTPAPVTDVIGTVIALPAKGDISREGYNFLGWATTPDASEALNSFVIPSQGQTLYAVWQLAVLPEIVAIEGSGAVIDNDRNLIFGLSQGINVTSILGFITSTGNTRLEFEFSFNMGTGTAVKLIDNASNEVLETYYIVIFGDIDGDGIISSSDCSILLNAVAYNVSLPEDSAYYYAANIDGASGLSAIDASTLLNVVAFNTTLNQSTGTTEVAL